MVGSLSFVSNSFIEGIWVVALASAASTISGATFHPLAMTLLTSGWYFVVFSLSCFNNKYVVTVCKFYKLYGGIWCGGLWWRVIVRMALTHSTFGLNLALQ